MRRLSLALAAAAALALALAPGAAAEIVTSLDREGRAITFDVRTENVDVEWYAEHLRNAAHGDEIQRVRFVLVAPSDLRQLCGPGAAGCYSRGDEARITLPAGRSDVLLHTLLHEYGHHVDAWRGVAVTSREPNGSATWWAARGMTQLLAEGKVSHTYSLGWERAIGEIFAEDYAQLHVETPFRISWLAPPTEAIREALRKDLENVPSAPAPAAPRPPLIVNRSGSLRVGGRLEVPFELLGPGRRVRFTARVGPLAARAKIELTCSDGRRASRALAAARRSAVIDLRNAGPARCSVSLRNTGRIGATFVARLRLAVVRPGL